MPPRTYEEAIRYDSELMRLSEEIMNLDGWVGSNPSKTALEKIARLQQKLEDRHEAIRQEIEEETRSAEAESREAEYSANPLANEFEAYPQSLGKSVAAVSMLKSLFVDHYALARQPEDIKNKMKWNLDRFILELTEEQSAKYSNAIHEILEAAGDVDPETFNPNPAARDFIAFLQSIGVEDGSEYFFGDLFVDYHDLPDQPEDIKKEMIAALDAFIQELTGEQLERYSTLIDKVRNAARNQSENVGKT